MKKNQILIYCILGLVFLLTMHLRPFFLSQAVKTISLFYLVIILLRMSYFPAKYFILGGLLFSAAGDIILDVKFNNSFVVGLASFLIAHIFYIIAFMRNVQFQSGLIRYNLLLLIFTGGMAFFLYPNLGDLKIPVIFYMLVISFMVISSQHRKTLNKTLITGALLFMTSDSLLAINIFSQKFFMAPYIVMITYYLAQLFIVHGILKESALLKRGSR